MSIIDRVVAHFEGQGGGWIDVPEWGEGEEVLIIHWSALSLQEHATLQKLADGNHFKLACLALERNARDASGKRLFEGGDANKMMRKADKAVILRVAEAMLAAPSIGDAEKN